MSKSPTEYELESLVKSFNPLHQHTFKPISVYDQIFTFLVSERTCSYEYQNMWTHVIVEDYPCNFTEFTSTFLNNQDKNKIVLKLRRQIGFVDLNLCVMVDEKWNTQILKDFSDFESFHSWYTDMFAHNF
jgi:hypothetical protein